MSQVTTYLTLVWEHADTDGWTFLGKEQQEAVSFVHSLGIQLGQGHGETHLLFPLLAPITPEQLQGLTELKETGEFTSFYVRDEISHDLPVQDDEQDEDDGEVTQVLSEKLGFDVTNQDKLKAYWQRAIDDLTNP